MMMTVARDSTQRWKQRDDRCYTFAFSFDLVTTNWTFSEHETKMCRSKDVHLDSMWRESFRTRLSAVRECEVPTQSLEQLPLFNRISQSNPCILFRQLTYSYSCSTLVCPFGHCQCLVRETKNQPWDVRVRVDDATTRTTVRGLVIFSWRGRHFEIGRHKRT